MQILGPVPRSVLHSSYQEDSIKTSLAQQFCLGLHVVAGNECVGSRAMCIVTCLRTLSGKALIKNVLGNIALEEGDKAVKCHPFEPYGRRPFMHDADKE